MVRSLSVVDVTEPEALSSEDIGKKMTTVAFDFGILAADATVVDLCGIPGQDRFDTATERLRAAEAKARVDLEKLEEDKQPLEVALESKKTKGTFSRLGRLLRKNLR